MSTSADSLSLIELDFAAVLRAGVTDLLPELEATINRLTAAKAVDEGHGDICDQLIAAWAELARQQIAVNTATLITRLKGQRDQAAADLQRAETAAADAESDVDAAAQNLRDFQRSMVRGTWAEM